MTFKSDFFSGRVKDTKNDVKKKKISFYKVYIHEPQNIQSNKMSIH